MRTHLLATTAALGRLRCSFQTVRPSRAPSGRNKTHARRAVMAQCAPERRFHAAALVQGLVAATGIISLNIIMTGAAFGQLISSQWTGASVGFPGDWFSSANWSPVGVPTFNNAVTIDAVTPPLSRS
jgi:hypothetical protein